MAERHRSTLCLLLLFALPAIAQERPDPPQPKPAPEQHRFFNLRNDAVFTAAVGTRLADTIQTCHNLAGVYPNGMPKWHEDFYPTQSCAGVAAWEAGDYLAALSGSWLLHKTGHHKVEQLPMWASTAAAAAGMIYTSLHKHR